MIIAEIIGGLGNQLFQYAFARNLSILWNQPLKLDLSFFENFKIPDVYRLDRFKINAEIATTSDIRMFKRREFPRFISGLAKRIVGHKIFYHKKNHHDENYISPEKVKSLTMENIYLSGYWAGENSFMENAEILRKEIQPVSPLTAASDELLQRIDNFNSVSLHFRRNDYVGNPYFAELTMNYYSRAIKYISANTENPVFFLFSDDPEWVADNFDTDMKFIIVDVNNSQTDYQDLILMSRCKHNIMANSTFSWWAAWLNENPDKIVMAPKKWFNNASAQKKYDNNHLVAINWIKINNE